MNGYSKWHPNRVYIENGRPVIYSKADKAISVSEAGDRFKAALATLTTWGARALTLAAAEPISELRTYHLEDVQWRLNELGAWMRAMQSELDSLRGQQREQETIDKLLALADRTDFPEEADTARRLAAKRQRERGNQ